MAAAPRRRRSACRSRRSCRRRTATDRKSTRLNSSHSQISYAVFCLKNKNQLLQALRAAAAKLVPNFAITSLPALLPYRDSRLHHCPPPLHRRPESVHEYHFVSSTRL